MFEFTDLCIEYIMQHTPIISSPFFNAKRHVEAVNLQNLFNDKNTYQFEYQVPTKSFSNNYPMYNAFESQVLLW